MSIQTGWHWWNEKKNAKIFIIGLDELGLVYYRTEVGGKIVESARDQETAKQFVPIPECTGWDWKPKEIPKAGEKWLYTIAGGYLNVRHVDNDCVFYVWDSGVPAGLSLDCFIREFRKASDE